MNIITNANIKSVKSINPCKSVIQTIYDIIKAGSGVPIAIGIKVETKEGRVRSLLFNYSIKLVLY
jgi:hypothetical protein